MPTSSMPSIKGFVVQLPLTSNSKHNQLKYAMEFHGSHKFMIYYPSRIWMIISMLIQGSGSTVMREFLYVHIEQ